MPKIILDPIWNPNMYQKLNFFLSRRKPLFGDFYILLSSSPPPSRSLLLKYKKSHYEDDIPPVHLLNTSHTPSIHHPHPPTPTRTNPHPHILHTLIPGRTRADLGEPGWTREESGRPGHTREDPGGPGRAQMDPGGLRRTRVDPDGPGRTWMDPDCSGIIRTGQNKASNSLFWIIYHYRRLLSKAFWTVGI